MLPFSIINLKSVCFKRLLKTDTFLLVFHIRFGGYDLGDIVDVNSAVVA